MKTVPVLLKPDCIGKLVVVQKFSRVAEKPHEIDTASMVKYVGILDSYVWSYEHKLLFIRGMDEPLLILNTLHYAELFVPSDSA